MAQDLASLVIGLRADVATLQSDLGKANALNARYAKDAEDTWTKAASSIGSAIGAGLVAAGVGFAALARQSIDAADNFNKMAQKVGISVESLSSLNVQAKLSDVSVESLQGGLAKLARNAADAAAGGKEQAAAFAAMGVSLKDANGNLRSTEEILGDVAKKFAGYEDSAAKTALAQKAFGKSGADLIPLLNELGEKGFKAVREEAEKFGQVISTETAAQAEEFNDNLTKTQFGLSAIANAIVADLLPSLVQSSAAFAEWINSDAVRSGVKGLVDDITGLVGVLAQVPAEIAATDASFREWNGTLGENSGSLDILLDQLKGFTNFKAGAPLTISWTQPEWLKAINTPTGGSALADKMAAANAPAVLATSTYQKLGAILKTVGLDFLDLGDNADDASLHVASSGKAAEDTGNKARKAQAPIVAVGDAAKKAAREHIEWSDSLKQAGAALQKIQGLYANYQSDINDIILRMQGADDAQISYVHSLDDIAAAYQQLLELGPPTAEAVDAVGTATQRAQERMDLTRTMDAQREAMQRYQEELQKTADMWGNFADAVFDAVTKSGNFLKNLLANLKSVVEQMLKEWFRTQVIGLFTGGGGGGYGGLIQAGMGMVAAGGGSNSAIFGAGVDPTATAFTTGGGNSYTSLFSMGKTIYSGFQSGINNLFSGSDAFTMGPPTAGGSTSSYYGGGYTSGWGQALGVAGGIYAGYNRYQQSGGGLGGVAGGVAYGYGTYAAGAAIATTAATGSLAAGLAAIPVVGWIALAAMVIDMASGGKLFGTKGKFNFGKQQAFVGPEGATVVAGYDTKGQQALFGGSTHSWTDIPVDQATQDAWNQFVTTLITGNKGLAESLGVEAGKIASGEFDVIFDKKGNIKSTSSIFNGVTYNEDQNAFQMREAAETMLNTLENVSSGISAAVEQYRADAEQLYAVTNSLATAAVYLHDGGKLLALGSDQSLTAILALAQGSQQLGESIDKTITRIIQAQAQYDQFVGQFKTVNYVDDFEGALSQINATMLANIKQANALAKAAGAAGASEEDLANIHAYAAKQAAAALQALEASAQSLAFGLGLTTQGSLEDVNSEIARLQAKANQGASAVSNFGSAISDAAQRATDAMNLLIGNLSPLNDQQKLQTALAGLRAGTASAEQVLEIGRRLYASSQAYTNLFNTVQSLSRGGTAATGGGGGGLGNISSGGGLTGDERQRLSELLKQQDQLQAAAQLQQYQTLAQQIAEIASAKGEDWQKVLEEMGINIADFEKGLGLTDEQTKAYIDSIQKQTDSNGENTASIVKVLNQILEALGGTPDTTTDAGSDTSVPGSRGHSTRSRYEDGQEIGRGFRDIILSTSPRGGRMSMPA